MKIIFFIFVIFGSAFIGCTLETVEVIDLAYFWFFGAITGLTAAAILSIL